MVVEQEVYCGGFYVWDGEIDGVGVMFVCDGYFYVLCWIYFFIDIQRYFGV